MNPGTVAVGFLDDGNWSACFGLSLIDLYLVDAHGPHRIIPNGRQLRNRCGTGGLVAGRNEVAAQTLDGTDCEWLWMIDTDMGFAPDTVERLVAAAHPVIRPVVGGLCFKLQRDGTAPYYGQRYLILPAVFRAGASGDKVGFAPIRALPDDSLMRVDATGAACLLVHRGVLERMRERYGDHWFDPVTHPPTDTTFSEDLSFCIRLAQMDIPIFVHTGVGTTHDKGGIFLDREAFERQGLDADLNRPAEVVPCPQ